MGGDIWRRAGVQALSFFLLVYKNVYLMPHKRPCAHLLPLPPPYAPSPTVEPLEREALALGGETLMGEAAVTGWVRCFCWVGGGDEEDFPVSFYYNSPSDRVAKLWAMELIQFKSWGFSLLGVYTWETPSLSLSFLSLKLGVTHGGNKCQAASME